jgi:hypothetical protein
MSPSKVLGCAVSIILSMAGRPALAGADPAEVSGVLIPERDHAVAEAVPGALLLVPRLAIAAVSVPVREGLIVYERHNLRERVIDLFFDDSRRFGLYPIVTLETGLRPGLGARLVHRDLLGTGARLRLSADYGGELRRRLDAGVSNVEVAGLPLWLHLRGGWQRQPDASFYGIGDASIGSADASGVPARSEAAHHTRFDQEIRRAELGLLFDPAGPFQAGWSITTLSRRFAAPVDADLDQAAVRFDPASLTGWERGVDLVYDEVEVGVDTLRPTSPFVPAATPATGTKVVAFAGLAAGLRGDRTRYLRYGVDALRSFDLYGGDRVLLLRGHLEGVAGDESRIPFTDLPRLGGPSQLRGFAPGRFRDRIAVAGTLEYRYPIWRQMSGFLFVDGGRVMRAAELAAPRLGGGGGLEILQGDAFRLRAQAATSSEGLFFQLAFEPAYRVQTPGYRI